MSDVLHKTSSLLVLQESIIDASEDSQLEAAIAASLMENSTEATSNQKRDNLHNDTPDDDSLTEFTDSESEFEKPLADPLKNDSVKNGDRTKTVKGETAIGQPKKEERVAVEKSIDVGSCVNGNNDLENKDVNKQSEVLECKNSEEEDGDTLDPSELSEFTFHFVTIFYKLYDHFKEIAWT